MKWPAIALLLASLLASSRPVEAADVSFRPGDGSLKIVLGDRPIAEYVWNDEQVRRPYLRHLHTPSGRQITRNQPPVAGVDIEDHPTFHPGVWLAFGDLDGTDFWRGKGRVRQVAFVIEPTEGPVGSFTVRNAYEADDCTICTEDCRIDVVPTADGYRLVWQSTFASDRAEFAFGDQEEMGLGVRVASSMAVVRGGEIVDAAGRKNGGEVWGKQSEWCAYRGAADGRRFGIVLMPDPQNFRPSWFHARDYGLLVANPFGQKAFTKGEKSRIVVARGEQLRLRFGIQVFEVAADQPFDAAAAYQAFLH